RCDGIDDLVIDEDQLVMRTSFGCIRQLTPVAYVRESGGTTSLAACRYVKYGDREFGFALDAPASATVVIDPGITLDWSSYIGGSSDDYVTAIDNSVHLTVTGVTHSTDFPTKTGYTGHLTKHGNSDAFLARVDPTQTGTNQLLWSTYFGGGSDDAALALS